MRHPLFDPAAKKRTVSLTLNGDLHAKARTLGINVSQIAEAALAVAVREHLAQAAKADIEQDLAAYNAYVEKHGSPAEMLREWLAERDDAA